MARSVTSAHRKTTAGVSHRTKDALLARTCSPARPARPARRTTRVTDASKVKTDPAYAIPERMRAWVLDDPGMLSLVEKPIPMPGRAEVLVRIDAVAICA